MKIDSGFRTDLTGIPAAVYDYSENYLRNLIFSGDLAAKSVNSAAPNP
jgi:hypothetical protein